MLKRGSIYGILHTLGEDQDAPIRSTSPPTRKDMNFSDLTREDACNSLIINVSQCRSAIECGHSDYALDYLNKIETLTDKIAALLVGDSQDEPIGSDYFRCQHCGELALLEDVDGYGVEELDFD